MRDELRVLQLEFRKAGLIRFCPVFFTFLAFIFTTYAVPADYSVRRFSCVSQEFLPLTFLLWNMRHLQFRLKKTASESLYVAADGNYYCLTGILLLLLFEGLCFLPGILLGFLYGYNYIACCLRVLIQSLLISGGMYALAVLLRSWYLPFTAAILYCFVSIYVGYSREPGAILMTLCILRPMQQVKTGGAAVEYLVWLAVGALLLFGALKMEKVFRKGTK